MTEIRTLKLRLYPKPEQVRLLSEQLEACRFLSNACIEERTRAWKERRVRITKEQQMKELSELKQDLIRFKQPVAQVLQNVVKRVDKSFQNFFKVEGCGYPKYKSRARYNSMTYPQSCNKHGKNGSFSYGKNFKLSKLGQVRYLSKSKPSWHDNAKPKTCTVKREGEKWFAYITFEVEIQTKQRPVLESPIGIDMGLTSLLALSNNTLIPNPHFLKQNERKLKRLHRRVSRKQKGSKNRRKAVLKLNNAYQHLRNQRHDFTHKLTRSIAKNHSLVVVEDDLSGLSRGMLAKGVNDAAWGMIKRQLEYKCRETGSTYLEVDKNGTTQECYRCKTIVPKTLKDRVHNCPVCKLILPRDTNSAKDILNRGFEKLGLPTDRGEVTPVEMRGSCSSKDGQVLVVETGSPGMG